MNFKLVLCTLLASCWLGNIAFGQKMWTGTTSTAWNLDSNWSPSGVPTPADDVIIPDVTNDPSINNGVAAVAKSVTINASAGISIQSGGSLTVSGSTGFGIINSGLFSNSGTIQVDQTGTGGIQNNSDVFNNSGSITIGGTAAINGVGLSNSSVFNNHPGGNIKIDRTAQDALTNSGTFNNSAKITIGSVADITLNGITVFSTFNNNTGGVILIDRVKEHAIAVFGNGFNNAAQVTIGSTGAISKFGILNAGTVNNNIGGTIIIDQTTLDALLNLKNFYNNATIKIGGVAAIGGHGIDNTSFFENRTGAEIKVDRTRFSGIYNVIPSDGSFVNSGNITIGATASISEYGIYSSESSFINNTPGIVRIDRTTLSGIFYQGTVSEPFGPKFLNASQIFIGSVATIGSHGIENKGAFQNNGGAIMRIDRTVGDGISNTSQFVSAGELSIGKTASIGGKGISNANIFRNDAGGSMSIDRTTAEGILNTATFQNSSTLTIGTQAIIGTDGVRNQLTFINQPCAVMTLFDNLNNSGTFSNEGFLTINTAQLHTNTGSVINNGMLEYPEGNPVPGVTNNNFIAAPVTGECTLLNALQKGSTTDFTIGSTWYTNIALTTPAGMYNPTTNIFTITNLPENSTTRLYFIATDGVSNCTSLISVKVTYDDVTPPVLVCKPYTAVLNGSNTANVVYSDIFQSSSDNCGTPSVPVITSNSSFDCSHVGPNTLTLSANDGHGNTGTCSATVTVADNTLPTVTCKSTTAQISNTGTASIQISDVLQSATDNCGTVNPLSVFPNTFDCSNLGTQIVTLTVQDAHGNNNTCLANVMVVDDILPTAVCKDIIVYLNSSGMQTITPADVFQSAADNCGTISLVSVSPNVISCNNTGSNTVTLTVTDGHDNTGTCIANVAVFDNTAPTVVCKNHTAYLNAEGAASIVIADVLQSAVDNCGSVNQLSVIPNTFACNNLGANTVILSVSDSYSNISTCSAVITIIDQIPPTITCPADQTVSASNTCGGIVGNQIALATNVADNCAVQTGIAVSQSPAANTPLSGHNDFETITLTADDGNGNTTPCTFKVTLKDITPPTITCPADQTVSASNTCGGIVGNRIALATNLTDNCAVQTGITVSQSPAANTPLSGHNDFETITLTADDGNGNTTPCTFKVTLKDITPPTITCPGPIVKTADPQTCTAVTNYVVTSADNCSIVSTIPTWGLVSGSAFPGGTSLVIWQTTDIAGHTVTCSFSVTVTDTQLPSITCPANQTKTTDSNQCSAVVTYPAPSFSDNCSSGLSIVRTSGLPSGSQFPKGTHLVNWKVTDGAGNSAVCNFSITVNDGQAPTIACPANMVKMTGAGQCSAVVTYNTPVFADNCTGASASLFSGQASGTTFEKGTNTIIWRAIDAAGLTAACTFTVTVNDGQQPSIVCPANQTRTTDPNACTAAVSYSTPTFTDNCAGGSVALQSGLASGAAFPKGLNTVIWRATDAAGLTKTCTFRVTVNDTQLPTITCPAPVVVTGSVNNGVCAATVSYATPTATDNCMIASNYLLSGLPTGSMFLEGVTVNVWKSTDNSGLTATCAFTVTVSCGTASEPITEARGREDLTTFSQPTSGSNLDLHLAPNPATAEVHISVEGLGENGGVLMVLDAAGRMVWQQQVISADPSNPQRLNVSAFAAGIYLVALRSEGVTATKRLIVSKL